MQLEYIDIDEFELKWRWTQESHCLMPLCDLNNIKPLSPKSAELLYTNKPMLSGNTQNIECKESPIDFLCKNIGNETIYISWSPTLAVETSPEILIKYFGDFCYPSSDNVSIWPVNKSWLLQYHHYEVISFVD